MSNAVTDTSVAESPALSVSEAIPRSAVPRNIAVDAYRGFVMLLMMGEV